MKKSFPWLVLVVGIFFSTLLWSSITIPYDQSNTIVGQYSISKINPLNDTLRGLFFIFFPLTLYLIVFLNINRNLATNQIFKNDYLSSSKNLNYLSVLLISFSVLEFYSLNYKNFLGIIDVHHEGTFLTAQLNFLLKDKVWTGTFFDYGFLGNTIGIFPNYIFDNYTIGIQRFFFKFLILLNKIFLILICKEITNCIDLKKKKEIFFLIFSLSALTLASFYEDVTPFHSRTFIYLIFALLTFKLIKSKNNIILSLALSSFSLLSLLFYWDIGSYINVLLVFLLIYLLFTRRYKEFYTLFSGIIICWLIFYILTPLDEFKQFFNQYLIIINISDYLIGIEFPKPFSDKSTRHTKALLLIIFSGVLVINFIFNKTKDESLNSKFILLFLFVSSIIFFKSGLTRSDGPHIKYTSGIYMLLIFFFISYYLVNNLQISNFFNKFYIFFKNKIFLNSLIILICFLFFTYKNMSNLINVFNPKKNFLAITNVNDKKFIDNDYFNFLNIYDDLVKNETCIQQFTDDNAIPYLINKPTCTKYYVNGHIIKNWTENNFIKELKESSPNYIVYSSKINWFKDRNNAPNADKYILDNYSLYKDLTPWQIYKKNSF